MPLFPSWKDESPEVFLREVARGFFVGAERAACARQWDLVVDLHGVQIVTADDTIVCSFPDGEPVPVHLLDQVHIKTERVIDKGGTVLFCCEMGRSRSASVAYAMLRSVAGVCHGDAYERISTQMHVPAGHRKLVVTYPRKRTFESALYWVTSRMARLSS